MFSRYEPVRSLPTEPMAARTIVCVTVSSTSRARGEVVTAMRACRGPPPASAAGEAAEPRRAPLEGAPRPRGRRGGHPVHGPAPALGAWAGRPAARAGGLED